MIPAYRPRWPRSLYARLLLIFFLGLALTQVLSFSATVYERDEALRRVLSNLIDNALKFSNQSELLVETLQNGQITIAVQDRGPGIPVHELEAVFQPFYRLEASRNRASGGTGLGLAIARQLSLAMNATLSLENRPGGGLIARLTLPN